MVTLFFILVPISALWGFRGPDFAKVMGTGFWFSLPAMVAKAKDKVLLIDDDEFMHTVLQKHLAADFEIRNAHDGEKGIETASQWHPDVILLDVEMPGQNGYEVCDHLKQSDNTKDIPVIFLSAKSSLRERMLGYEMGADDYLVKPSSEQEISTKLRKVIAFSKVKQGLKNSADTAQKTALEAMSTSFDLGKAVRFIERTYSCSTFRQLGEQLMQFMYELELASVCMFIGRSGLHFYSSTSKAVAPLEQELMQMLHGEKRFTDFGCRTQINYPQVALLIKNMPLDDRWRYGRLKDTLPFLLGAVDAKIRVIDAEQALMSQSGQLSASTDGVKLALQSVKEGFDANIVAASTIMSELFVTVSMDLRHLGLETDQEEYICEKVESASRKLHGCLAESSSIEKTLNEVIQLLEHLVQEQNKIISETLKTDFVDEDQSSDIELF